MDRLDDFSSTLVVQPNEYLMIYFYRTSRTERNNVADEELEDNKAFRIRSMDRWFLRSCTFPYMVLVDSQMVDISRYKLLVPAFLKFHHTYNLIDSKTQHWKHKYVNFALQLSINRFWQSLKIFAKRKIYAILRLCLQLLDFTNQLPHLVHVIAIPTAVTHRYWFSSLC